MSQPIARMASTRTAHCQPHVSMRNCTRGLNPRIPTPIPAEAMPMAVANRSGNQAWIRITAGTQPARLTPTAVIPLNVR